jgi:uncharacterized protein YegP (UPF0339 family)
MASFQIFRDTRGEFRYRLRADNGEIVLASEAYTTKSSALSGIESVKRNATLDERYRRKQIPAGYCFTLTAANNEVIGVSEVYMSATARDKGIEAVKRGAPSASTNDVA